MPFISKDYLIGTVMENGNKALLLYDMQGERGGIKQWSINGFSLYDIILPVFATNDYIVGWMDSSVYELLTDQEKVPMDFVEHMEQGGRVLIFYYFKKR